METGKQVILTFFAPPLKDSDSTNEKLRKKIMDCGQFEKGGTMYRSREIYDTYRHGGAFPMFHLQDDPEVVQQLLAHPLSKQLLGDGVETRQGVYREVARKQLPAFNALQQVSRLSYIVLAYKTVEPEPSRQLLDNWKIWTGARAMLEDFGDRVPIQEVLFYARETPHDFDVFGYVVLMSFETTPEVRQWVLYYIQRLRVERWFGYMTLYAIAPSFNKNTDQAPDSNAAITKAKIVHK